MKSNTIHIVACVLALSLFALLPVAAREARPNDSGIEVTGSVIDEASGAPAFGLSVQSSLQKVFTDEQGHFTLKVAHLQEVITVSGEDYARREIPLKGKSQIEIKVFSNSFNGYSKDVESPTGSVSTTFQVEAAKNVGTDVPYAMTPDELYQVQLGGDVRAISRSGANGAGAATFIRGLNSLNANAQPLYIVDGVIWDSQTDLTSIFEGFQPNVLGSIDVHDIKSITVLKDGTSLYGTKAANGVVMINTNRGESAVTKIDLNAAGGFTEAPSNLPMMNGDDFRVYATEMLHSNGYTAKDISNLDFLNEDELVAIYNRYHNVTDWGKEAYQGAWNQTYSIGVNGGDEKALYYFSVGYTNRKGVIRTTSTDRINTRFNADINMAKKLTMALNVGFTYQNRYLYDDGMNKYTSPSYMSMVKAPFMSPYSFTATGGKSKDYDDADIFGIGNPAAFFENAADRNKIRQYRFDIGIKPVWKITKGLTLSDMFSYNLDKHMESYYSPMMGTTPQYLEQYDDYSENTQKSQTMRNISLFNDLRIAYSFDFEKEMKLTAMLGWRYITNDYEMDFVESHNSGTDNNISVSSSYDFTKSDGINNTTHTVSTYLNVSYSYLDRYFLNAAVSLDGSSRFGKETKEGLHIFGHSFGLFPAVNAAWLISSEPFMRDAAAVDLLKLRVGYDVTGNDDIEDYASYAYFKTKRYIEKANGMVLANLENPTLQWETTGRVHAGIDLGLFNERLNLTADIYSSRTKNLLTLKQVNNVAGVDYYWSNDGELSNKGVEATADVRLMSRRNFRWNLGISMGTYKNRIESLPEKSYVTEAYGAEILTMVGQPAGVFYGYKTDGVLSTEAAAKQHNLALIDERGKYTYFKAGDMKFIDVDKDGVLNDADKQIIGDPNPDIYGSFFTKFALFRLSLNVLFTYSLGNDVYNHTRSQLESASDYANQTTAALSRWKAEGQVTSFPKATYGDPMGNSRFSDRWIEDGSYLRLKTLTLSYHIPIESMFIKGLDVWAAANNLLTFTKYLGMDPESSVNNGVLYQGIDAGMIPQTRSYHIGIKINL